MHEKIVRLCSWQDIGMLNLIRGISNQLKRDYRVVCWQGSKCCHTDAHSTRQPIQASFGAAAPLTAREEEMAAGSSATFNLFSLARLHR
jgi:hypothetical protein